jgi:ferredoxin/flavodoxin
MQIRTVHLVCFSPTRTTLAVLEAIGRGTGLKSEVTDVTPPEPAKWPKMAADDLLVIGAPVYAGRLPVTATERFNRLRGSDGPAVVVAVYGNRAFEDALVELEDIVDQAGFKTVAGAAFIGEHSYHTEETPIAAGRPDDSDIARAEAFGKELRSLLEGISATDIVKLNLPGNRPYREMIKHGPNTPVTDADACTRCGECVIACPVAAIPARDPTTTDASQCIACAACVKVCPVDARAITSPRHLEVLQRVVGLTRERHEPETWLAEA